MPPDHPQLMILSPAPGEVIQGSQVSVKVKLPPEFSLVDPAVQTPHAGGEGHLHIWLDALPAHDDAVSVTLADSPEYQYAQVFSGLHTLHTEFFRNDHLPYEPRQAAAVEFETAGAEQVTAGVPVSVPVPPESSGGLFLPQRQGTMPIIIIVLIVAIALLWYSFGRSKEKEDGEKNQ